MFYRGISTDCKNINILSKNPIAVSFDKNVAIGFATPGDLMGCLLDIRVPKNSHILAIDRVSVYDGDESEILLMPNNKLIKLNILDNDKKDNNNNTKSYKGSNYSGDGDGANDEDEDADDDDDDVDHDYNYDTYVKEKTIKFDFHVDSEKNKQIVPIPQPVFVHKMMTLSELVDILITTELVNPEGNVVNMLHDLTYHNEPSVEIISKIFKSIRTWQILYCGFGDVQLAIQEFWTIAFDRYTNNQHMNKLIHFKQVCDIAFASKKTLLNDNKVSIILDRLQDFIRPFSVK